MPRPGNWRAVGVPDDIPELVTEGELCRRLGLSGYAGYHLRRLGIIQPVARTSRSLLYSPHTPGYLEQFRVRVGERSYLDIDGEQVW